jgi:aryl-alcohol dehydrogenase-like predicted oxidoreductase
VRLVLGSVGFDDAAQGFRVLDRFADAGGSALDVANQYGSGASARIVGRWLGRRPGGTIEMYAKGCHPPHCRPELVGAEVDRARELLGVERVDVFVLHRDDEAQPVAAWADALLAQVQRGAIGAFGVSNWTLARLRDLHAQLGAADARHLRAFSNHFSLAEMMSAPWDGCLSVGRDELREAGELGVEVLAWSSLAIGFFAGRNPSPWDSPANRARRDRAAKLAARLGTTAPAVALAYVLHQPDHVRPVVGTRSVAHLDDSLEAGRLRLDPDDLRWLERGA